MKNTLVLLVILVSMPMLLLAQHRRSYIFNELTSNPYRDVVARNTPSSAKVMSHEDLATLSIQFGWNDSLSQWDSIGRTHFAYTSIGQPSTILYESYQNNAFAYYSRNTRTYNSQGLVIVNQTDGWDGSAWVPGSRYLLDYDSQGSQTIDFYMAWNGASWDSIGGRRSTFTYVQPLNKVSQELVEYWDSQNPVWTLSDRMDSHWPNAQGWDTLTSYTYNGGWVPTGRTIVYGWHNYEEELPDSALLQSYNGSGWDDDDVLGVSYGANDSYDWIYYGFTGASWEPYGREEVQIDSLGHEFYYGSYYWSNGWVQTDGQQSHYFYDNQQRTSEIITYNLEQQTGQYLASHRILFPSFFTSAADPVRPRVAVTAYPNPCTDKLIFQLAKPENTPVQVSLYDLQGRLRVQSLGAAPGSNIEISLDPSLAAGTYVYRVLSRTGVAEGKISIAR